MPFDGAESMRASPGPALRAAISRVHATEASGSGGRADHCRMLPTRSRVNGRGAGVVGGVTELLVAGGGGLLGTIGTAQDGSDDDGFSIVLKVAIICSCFDASCSRLRRTTASSRVTGSNWRASPGGVAAAPGEAATGAVVGKEDSSGLSDGAHTATIALASSPWDCQDSVAATPKRTASENRNSVRKIRRPIEGRRRAVIAVGFVDTSRSVSRSRAL